MSSVSRKAILPKRSESVLAKNREHLAGKIKPSQVSSKVSHNRSSSRGSTLKTPKKTEEVSLQDESVLDDYGDGGVVDHSKRDDSSQQNTVHSREESDALNEVIGKEDLDLIFNRLRLPSLMLTNMKIKKSKQAIQDAFSVLNANMATIDRTMKDLLFFFQELLQILYVCLDSRLHKVIAN